MTDHQIGFFSDRGWTPPLSGLTYEHAGDLVAALDTRATTAERDTNAALWQLADLLVWCEDNLGDKFSQITPDPTRNRRSYTMLMRIARAFPDHERRWSYPEVSIWTHGETYNLPDWIADEMLEDYATGLLTRSQLRDECQKLRDGVANGSQAPPSASLDSEPENAPAEDTEQPQPRLGCPLCLGAGQVEDEAREAYLEFLAERESVAG